MKVKINELRQLFTEKSCDNSHWIIGKNYLIRTVTMIQVGKLEKITANEIVLSNARWIADTGRFAESLLTGQFSEVELFNPKFPCIIGRGALVDAQIFDYKLPNATK